MSTIEKQAKEIVEKDLELEELQLRVANSNTKLSEVLNEFTEEILTRDRTISTLRLQIKQIRSQAAPSTEPQIKKEVVQPQQQETGGGVMDNFLSKYFK